jgi:hypothetical protein
MVAAIIVFWAFALAWPAPMVWALRDRLQLSIDALDFPRFRLARFKNPAAGSP